MTLETEQINQFQQDGWTFARNLFNGREVAAMQAEIERFKREGLLRNVATDGDRETRSETLTNLQLCPMFRHSELFRALPFETKVVNAVEKLIGSPIILHLEQVFLKPSGKGMGTHWHQDNAYFGVADPLHGTAMWIAIHDATIDNGTLQVIPGAFTELLQHVPDPYSDHHICCDPPEELLATATSVEVEAGSVVFFCYGTPHCTGDNRSQSERAGVAFHFLQADYTETTSGGNLVEEGRDYRPYLSGPLASGGLNEYGVKVAGTWETHVARSLETA